MLLDQEVDMHYCFVLIFIQYSYIVLLHSTSANTNRKMSGVGTSHAFDGVYQVNCVKLK